jgi:hypothetical protein
VITVAAPFENEMAVRAYSAFAPAEQARPRGGRVRSSRYFGMTTKKKPRRRNDRRRLNIVSGLVQGKSMATIAREEGVSRQTIWKQAESNDVRQILVAAVNNEWETIGRVFDRVLRVIEEAFEARVMRTSKDGAAIDLGPDHYARLAAVGTFMKLLTAGRPVPKAAEPRKDEGSPSESECPLGGSSGALTRMGPSSCFGKMQTPISRS